MFGRVFGGATAYPQAKGVWRDDERSGAPVKDEPVVVHCYTTSADIEDSRNAIFLDGVFVEDERGELLFHPALPLREGDLEALVATLA